MGSLLRFIEFVIHALNRRFSRLLRLVIDALFGRFSRLMRLIIDALYRRFSRLRRSGLGFEPGTFPRRIGRGRSRTRTRRQRVRRTRARSHEQNVPIRFIRVRPPFPIRRHGTDGGRSGGLTGQFEMIDHGIIADERRDGGQDETRDFLVGFVDFLGRELQVLRSWKGERECLGTCL